MIANVLLFTYSLKCRVYMQDFPLTLISAFAVGLLHSLEPSHAKAVLAAYFLDHRRTRGEAVAFAGIVTIAHTLSIFSLAIAGYALGPLLSGDSVERWGSMIGGGVMILMGFWMLWSEKRVNFHRHDENIMSCCGHSHDFFHHHSSHHDHSKPSSWKQIFILGFCSGAVPCMSGLAVLTMAWSTANFWWGMLLISAFSVGLGSVVLILCLAMQQAARAMDRYWQKASRWNRYLPLVSSGLIILMGVFVIWHEWRAF